MRPDCNTVNENAQTEQLRAAEMKEEKAHNHLALYEISPFQLKIYT